MYADRIGQTATVEVDGEHITGEIYHVRENGWPCVQQGSGGRVASGPEADPMFDPCSTCGREARNPRKVIRDGALYECCVDVIHDPYVVRASNHSAFVARARKAGITGKC